MKTLRNHLWEILDRWIDALSGRAEAGETPSVRFTRAQELARISQLSARAEAAEAW